MYLNCIDLDTGALSRAERSHITGESLARVSQWLSGAVNGARVPLPMPTAGCDAVIHVDNGGLLVTVFAGADPLVTFGVAHRSRQGPTLWSRLRADIEHHSNSTRPSDPWLAVSARPALVEHMSAVEWLADGEPWLAVEAHPALTQHLSAVEWLSEFEQCVAWAWITCNA